MPKFTVHLPWPGRLVMKGITGKNEKDAIEKAQQMANPGPLCPTCSGHFEFQLKGQEKMDAPKVKILHD